MKTLFPTVILIAFLAVTCQSLAFPEPEIIPKPGVWTLNTVFDQPQQITLKIPGQAQKKRFWYIILTLTNHSSNNVPFYSSCDLMTDTFQIIAAGKDTRKIIFDKIKRRHQGKYPFIEPLDLIDNRILQGKDNTKDVAVIWSDFDPKAKYVKFFIEGLSNETVAIEDPINTDENGKPKKIFLRKTLALKYSIAGDPKLRAKAKLKYISKSWVMR